MNTIYFTPLSLSQLFKEKGIELPSLYGWYETVERVNDKYDRNSTAINLNASIKIVWKLGDWTEAMNDGIDGKIQYPSYNLSELPDVFRKVFIPQYFDKEMEWLKFCKNYFKDPAKAWETLEKTIRELK